MASWAETGEQLVDVFEHGATVREKQAAYTTALGLVRNVEFAMLDAVDACPQNRARLQFGVNELTKLRERLVEACQTEPTLPSDFDCHSGGF